MYPATDTNGTSDQWFYLQKNIIFLVIILILKHILFDTEIPQPSNELPCMLHELVFLGCHSQFVLVRTHSDCIRIAVKFYDHTLRLGYGCIPMRYYASLVLFYNENGH